MQCIIMNREMRTLLRLLGFPSDLDQIPPLIIIKQHFRKQCLLKHPDKPTGDKKAFQDLHDAYRKIVRNIQTTEKVFVEESDDEDEEDSKRKYFKEFSLYGN